MFEQDAKPVLWVWHLGFWGVMGNFGETDRSDGFRVARSAPLRVCSGYVPRKRSSRGTLEAAELCPYFGGCWLALEEGLQGKPPLHCISFDPQYPPMAHPGTPARHPGCEPNPLESCAGGAIVENLSLGEELLSRCNEMSYGSVKTCVCADVP